MYIDLAYTYLFYCFYLSLTKECIKGESKAKTQTQGLSAIVKTMIVNYCNEGADETPKKILN